MDGFIERRITVETTRKFDSDGIIKYYWSVDRLRQDRWITEIDGYGQSRTESFSSALRALEDLEK